MTIEHQDLEYLKKKFEDGDRPVGDDFANLLESCHNTRQDTNVTITGSLSVQKMTTIDSTVNGRNISNDGARLDSVYSNVNSLSTSWEESADIQSLSDNTDATIASLSATVDTTVNSLSSTVDATVTSLSDTTSTDFQTLSSKLDTNTQTLDTKIDYESQLLHVDVQSISGEVSNISVVSGDWNDMRVNVMTNSAQWAEQTDITDISSQINNIETTVQNNSAAWGVDQDTQSISLMNDVDVTTVEHNDILRYDSSEQKWYPSQDMYSNTTGVTALTSFKGLEDTPVTYTGAGKFVQINNSNDGLMFVEHDTDSWNDTNSVVATNSAFWSDHTDITNTQDQLDDICSVVQINSADWAERTDITDISDTVQSLRDDVETLSDDVSINVDVTNNLQNQVNTIHDDLQNDITNLTQSSDDVITTVSTNSAHWADHTDVTDLQTVVQTNSSHWGDHTDTTALENQINNVESAANANLTSITNIESDVDSLQTTTQGHTSDISDILTSLGQTNNNVDDVSTTVATNSSTWDDTYTHIRAASADWAVLDSNGRLMTDQIPELSITQTYTVQNPEEVETLNPVEGLQRGDIVIVNTTYDNLVAKQDNPSGAYNSSTKAYSGYSKLARPDAFVTSVNDEYGNVTLTSDDISDEDQDNKWVTQQEKDTWNAINTNYINASGDTLTGDLDTQSKLLSGGIELHDIFSINNNINGDQQISGDSQAQSYKGAYKTTDNTGAEAVGITQDVNVGGNILHIVNGIIVGVTDES